MTESGPAMPLPIRPPGPMASTPRTELVNPNPQTESINVLKRISCQPCCGCGYISKAAGAAELTGKWAGHTSASDAPKSNQIDVNGQDEFIDLLRRACPRLTKVSPILTQLWAGPVNQPYYHHGLIPALAEAARSYYKTSLICNSYS